MLDEMISPSVAEALRHRGHDVTERFEWCGLADSELLSIARAEERAIVTKNIRDVRPLAAEAIVRGGPGHAGMVFNSPCLRTFVVGRLDLGDGKLGHAPCLCNPPHVQLMSRDDEQSSKRDDHDAHTWTQSHVDRTWRDRRLAA
jgi:hypothetical protein